MLEKHVGGLLAPPSSFERLSQLEPFIEQDCPIVSADPDV